MLKIGKKAPVFSLLDQNSEVKNLKDLTGKWAVIYFYPKDDTPGCTKEACMIAEVYKDFEKKDVTVFGVSKDSPKSHLKFAEKYNLPFTLLSDPEATMIQKYEAWKEKSMFGKKYMGIDRITYVIDPNGKIAKVYEKVDPASHALQILADIKLLQAG
jgi:peroxiredoxin Q/BCP